MNAQDRARAQILANDIIARGHYGPLELTWLALGGCVIPAVAEIVKDVFGQFKMHSVVKIMIGMGDDISISKHPQLDAFAQKFNMWEGYSSGVGYKPTHAWVNHIASYAFMCMRTHMCKDTASIIAREVAKLYMRDLEFIKTLRPRVQVSMDMNGFVHMYPIVTNEMLEQMLRDRMIAQ